MQKTSPEPATEPATPTPKARKTNNEVRFREEWLQQAITRLRPMFEKAGAIIPDLGRAAIGFTSRGGKGTCVGECWASVASGDGHFEIFIRPDKSDPVEVLGILVHELVHAALPIGSGHGPAYKTLAQKIGLEGQMRHAMPGMHLIEILKGLANDLGPLPHASLDIEFRELGKRKKQKTHMLKAFCEGVETNGKREGCDFTCRLTATHAQKGAPYCGIHNVRMKIDWPVDEDGDQEENAGSDTSTHSPAPAPAASSPPPGFRPVEEGEVFEPGRHFQIDTEKGGLHVLKVDPREGRNGPI
jgi:hypothetical protein